MGQDRPAAGEEDDLQGRPLARRYVVEDRDQLTGIVGLAELDGQASSGCTAYSAVSKSDAQPPRTATSAGAARVRSIAITRPYTAPRWRTLGAP